MDKPTRSIEQIETEIHFYKNQTAQNIIEIGKRLIEAKESLPHGEWGKWLEERVEFSHTSAKRFMQVAREFSNSPTLGVLTQSKVFALLDLPPDQRQDFIESNPVDEMTTRELQAAIKARKEAEQKAAELEKALQTERTKPPQVVEKVVEKAPDWLVKQADEARNLKMEAQRLDEQVKALEKEKERLGEKLKLTAREAAETEELKRNIARLQQHSEETMNRWRAIDELATMVSQIEHLISGKLAPTRYSLALTELADNPTVMENVSRIVATVQGWCNEMNTVIRNSKIVEVETYE